MEERLRSHYESLARVIRFTRTADAKAAPVLALQVALLGGLTTRFEDLYSIIGSEPWDAERGVVIGLAAIYGLLLSVVILLAAMVYMPMNARTNRSFIFFEDVAAMEFQEFQSRARNMSSSLIEHQLLDQVHRVSKIASTKMRRVRWAIVLSLPAIALWFVLLAWSSV